MCRFFRLDTPRNLEHHRKYRKRGGSLFSLLTLLRLLKQISLNHDRAGRERTKEYWDF